MGGDHASPDGLGPPWLGPRRRGSDASELAIGLVNIMPATARRATEDQFRALLPPVVARRRLRFRVFTTPGEPEHGTEDLSALWQANLDGMIVTGTEPGTTDITDEPAWPLLAHLVDFAAENTLSTLWCCMAAHAAVFRLGGPHRRRLPEKLWGVFPCQKSDDHILTADAPAGWPVPHSRHNDLDPAALRESGYDILSNSAAVGADLFARRVGRTLFVMAQGHLEYGPESLFLEYRREMRRFILGRRPDWPAPPVGYLDANTVSRLERLRTRIVGLPREAQMAAIRRVTVATPAHSWHRDAQRLYSRWVTCLEAWKTLRANTIAVPAHYWTSHMARQALSTPDRRIGPPVAHGDRPFTAREAVAGSAGEAQAH
jgi:homoserine O-succinyltransferase/O-acetyltransferase